MNAKDKPVDQAIDKKIYSSLDDGLYAKNFEAFFDSKCIPKDEQEVEEIMELQKRFRLF
ncbi:hypothetical protein GW935_01205 [Candidatus Falkowbacteria bacterium]|nr:hypothetical protein [Candidatus Falkowbacteria bacterium]